MGTDHKSHEGVLSMKLSFTKMQGCANDYIYLDCRESGVPENIAALSEKLSRRHLVRTASSASVLRRWRVRTA